ncbi:MAG: acylneuraminate cytidylyltransferase family protein [Anaerolineales bacterium]|jgi:CMP-N-acetylneuraminic acid synthetase
MRTIIALVPMRHHSQRVPGKNYRSFAGKPLFHHIIETLLRVPEIEEVLVDTDSLPIMEGIEKHFPQVNVLERSEALRGDEISMNEILAYDVTHAQANFYLQTHSTNPLLEAGTISRAIRTFMDHYPTHDSLYSVTRLQSRLWDRLGQAINHDPEVLIQTQDLPPVFEENSCIYIFTGQTLLSRRNRLGENPLMFEVDSSEAWDIDDELDFQIAEFLFNQRAESS